jgi:hypothetical protein
MISPARRWEGGVPSVRSRKDIAGKRRHGREEDPIAALAAAALLAAGCGSGHTSTGFLAGLSSAVRRNLAQDAAWSKAHPALVYDALASYVASHAGQGMQANVVQAVAGKNDRHGVPALLDDACRADLHPVRMPGPVPPRERAGFAAALAIWRQTPLVAAAFAGGYLLRAAADLRAVDASRYAAAIRELTGLASIPETGDTAAQMAHAHADVTALDKFFGTPGLAPNA